LEAWLDFASPKLAAAAGISNDAAEKLWYDSIMKLIIHVLKDPRAGFEQERHMEHYLCIGKQTGIQNFMDHIDILSNYLPLFPPLRGEVMKEFSDIQKVKVLYDVLPHYYIKNIKESNTEPIEMPLKAFFQFTLDIEEVAVNPGNDLRAMLEVARKRRPKPQFLRSRGWKMQR
jgi:hypothetical protein